MSAEQISRAELIKKAVGQTLALPLILGAMLFLPAGTLRYWEAWVYLAILLAANSFMVVYLILIRNDPELLARRLRLKEKEPEQKLIQTFSFIVCVVVFLLPGLDKRYGWSSVPSVVVVAADMIVVLGLGLFWLAVRENRWASHIIEVEQDQQVITTGPYALVRHPMYSAALLIFICSPLALGSYWALLPSALFPILLAARLRNEEMLLLRELEGYRAYARKVKYRLIPGLW
jgi:protein-S-isoprenylcysteine O-methyltransferase Ste14